MYDFVFDNTQPPEKYQDLGILKFGKRFFPNLFTNEFAPLHYQMMQIVFNLLHPSKKSRLDRQGYFLVHREAAKSTISSFLVPIYMIYMKNRKVWLRIYKPGWEGGNGVNAYDIVQVTIKENFILIVSETGSQAESFVSDIKDQLESRQDLAKIFGEKHPHEIETERKADTKWTKSAFITADNTAVWGVGSGMRVRGRKIRGHRPSFIIVDDMYSEENVKTKDRREGLKRWFFRGLINSLDSVNGKAMWLGTMVHPDIVYHDFLKAGDWEGVERPIISVDELDVLKGYLTKDDELKMPSQSFLDEIEPKFKTLSWQNRHSLSNIAKMYINAYLKGELDGFYQEYMNIAQSPDKIRISEDTFLQKNIYPFKENNRQMISLDYNNAKWIGEIYITIGVDIASSLTTAADDTVIIAGGLAKLYPDYPGKDRYSSYNSMPNGWIIPVIMHIEGGKYDVTEPDDGSRPGMAETIIKLCQIYKVRNVVIEANGQQVSIIREIRKQMQRKNIFIPVEEQYVNVNKEERIMSTVLSSINTYKTVFVNHSPSFGKLYSQLLTLGLGVHDDYPDALEKVFQSMIEPNYVPSVISTALDSSQESVDRELNWA